jgi:hypothetical protein
MAGTITREQADDIKTLIDLLANHVKDSEYNQNLFESCAEGHMYRHPDLMTNKLSAEWPSRVREEVFQKAHFKCVTKKGERRAAIRRLRNILFDAGWE